MVKILELLTPRGDIPLQQFHDHWRHPHGTMARNVRQVRRYFQNHRIRSPSLEDDGSRFEGVAEGYFDTLSDCQALSDAPFMHEEVFPDEERFLDRAAIQIMICEEEIISSGPHAGANLRLPSATAAYDLKWSDLEKPLAVKLFQFIADAGDGSWDHADDAVLGHRVGAFRHVRNRPAVTPSICAGVRELVWPTLTAFEAGVRADPAAWSALRDRPRQSFCILAQSERVL